jgi:hypothetical protein
MATLDTVRDRIVPAAGAGAAAYLLGYLLTWLLAGSRVTEGFADAPDWAVAAWYHLSAQFVPVVAEGSVGPFGGSDTLNLVAEGEATFLYAVPPLVLLAAGAAVAAFTAAEDAADGALAGALVVAGYLPLAALFALISRVAETGTVLGTEVSTSVAPQLPAAILLAGLLYPVVAGGLGGLLGAAVEG